jgi:transmembrane sensor
MKAKVMDNENYPEDYNELIFNFLNSSISKEEEEKLMVWLKNDVANKLYFDECHEVWLSTKLESAQKDFSSQEAFQRFKRNIKHNRTEKYVFRKLSISVGKAAAVLLIAFLSGILTLSLLHRGKTSDLTYYEITVPAGSKTKLNLPDGSKVWLNSQSKLSYASNYNQATREVKLEGEGYFKVAHDKNRPFLVHTSKISIRALGTEFNVKCYSDEGSIETILVKGCVKIEGNTTKTNNGVKAVVLKPNQRLIFIKETGKLYSDSLQTLQNQIAQSGVPVIKEGIRKEKMIIKAIDPKPLIAWKEDKLVFSGERFEEIRIKLERWYGVSIQIQDDEILSYHFKGSFEKETLEQALEALKLAAYFKYSIYKDQVIITK